MPPDGSHVVHLRVRDLRLIEPLDDLFRGECRKRLEDDRTQSGACRAALGIGREARVLRELRTLQYGLAEHVPLALVLKPEHDRLAITCWKRSIRIDGGVTCARARG